MMKHQHSALTKQQLVLAPL